MSRTTCPRCHGKRVVENARFPGETMECPRCNGSGFITSDHALRGDVEIPPHVRNAMKHPRGCFGSPHVFFLVLAIGGVLYCAWRFLWSTP